MFEMPYIYFWPAIQAYFDAGYSFVECRKRFGFSHSAWTKAVRSGKLRIPAGARLDGRRRHDWAAVQAYYDEGHSYRECRRKFRFCSGSWAKAIRRGELTTRERKIPIGALLRTSRSRASIKRRLLEAGILLNRCDWCGLTEWRGRPLSIQIDHVNGIRDDHRVENLRMLCPNCHSQTETFAAKNRRQT